MKTVCAKTIATRIGKPVILVSRPYPGLQDFLVKFTSECVFFFDEFEKTFGSNKSNDDGVTGMLLSVMDGAYNTTCRQVFLITTNNEYLDENFIGRPSRIRYRKQFRDISLKVVNEYIEDNLIDKSRTQEVIDMVQSLKLSTIDTLKAIVMDFNLHPQSSANSIRTYLNLEFAKNKYQIEYKKLHPDHPKYNTYTLEDLEHDKSLIGTKDPKDPEYLLDEDDLDIGRRTIHCDRSIMFMDRGDTFIYPIVRPLDEHNVVISEDSEGTRVFIHVLNPEYRATLYRDYSY